KAPREPVVTSPGGRYGGAEPTRTSVAGAARGAPQKKGTKQLRSHALPPILGQHLGIGELRMVSPNLRIARVQQRAINARAGRIHAAPDAGRGQSTFRSMIVAMPIP